MAAKKKSATYYVIRQWIGEAVDQKKLLILMVDDYSNIHTKYRLQDLNSTQISKKATLLLKWFDMPAISPVGRPGANKPAGVDPGLISRYLEEHASSLSKTICPGDAQLDSSKIFRCRK